MNTNQEIHMEVVRLRRISQSQPTAWEGVTRDNQIVHLFYKFGLVEAWLQKKVSETAYRWVTVASFHPEWLEKVTELERTWHKESRQGSLAPTTSPMPQARTSAQSSFSTTPA